MFDKVRSGSGEIWLFVDSARIPSREVADKEDSERWVEARDSSFDKIWNPLNTRNVTFSLSPTGNKEKGCKINVSL